LWFVVPLAAAWLVGAGLGRPAPAHAQTQAPETDRSFDVQLWQPALGPRPYFTLDGAKVPAHLELSVQLATSYQRNPFTLGTKQGPTQVESDIEVVRDQVTTELGLAIGLLDKFQVGLAIPFAIYQNGDDFNAMGMPTGTELSGGSLGDIRIEGKYQAPSFGPSQEFTFAVVPGLTVPTGDDKKFHGDKTVTGRLKAITEMQLEPVRAAAMLGLLLRDPSTNFVAEVGQQLMYALAVDYRVIKDVSVIGELFGRSGLKDFGKRYTDANPMEIDAGMRVGLPKMFSVTAGGGLGIVRGIGAPKYRAFLSVAWSPNFSDRDGDGVYDYEDRCNESAEDMDGFRDGDGCRIWTTTGTACWMPRTSARWSLRTLTSTRTRTAAPSRTTTPTASRTSRIPARTPPRDGRGKRPKDGCPSTAEDGDGDGVPDGSDRCLEEPEDRDGFQDEDGCPDVDNDNDGIPDNFDSCPTEAEDADGVDDADGCPDPDNDKDGFDDAKDRCPAQPETLNGNRDEDGCPDAGAELVTLTDSKIELRERLSFTGPPDKPVLARTTQTLLNLVALVMKGHREIQLVRVEVSPTPAAAAQARADAVAAFLVSKGVDAARLKAVGAGSGGNKVDFIIEKRVEPKAPAPTAP
jgi:outer membrane protein OmpA-like peptidoglycan-associated protein